MKTFDVKNVTVENGDFVTVSKDHKSNKDKNIIAYKRID